MGIAIHVPEVRDILFLEVDMQALGEGEPLGFLDLGLVDVAEVELDGVLEGVDRGAVRARAPGCPEGRGRFPTLRCPRALRSPGCSGV